MAKTMMEAARDYDEAYAKYKAADEEEKLKWAYKLIFLRMMYKSAVVRWAFGMEKE